MNFLEKNLEEIVFETPNELLHSRGLFIYGQKKRQVRIGNYGIADIITWYRYDNELNVSIIELKKDNISVGTLLQAMNYVRGVQMYFNRRRWPFPINFTITLIGRELDVNGSFCFFPDIIPFLKIYTYDYNFDGISFTQQEGYNLTNDGLGPFDNRRNKISQPFNHIH